MAGNLGYQVTFVEDATRAFDAHHPDGTIISAFDIARASCASLHGEFATVFSTAELVVSLQS
jgi:nicotinamidase-related amidase